MNKEIKTILRKTVKLAGVTCVAAGAVALVTSGAALKALTEGGKYLKETVTKILNEGSADGPVIVEEPVEETDFEEA